jgi:small-conductance mechanosensitive channel
VAAAKGQEAGHRLQAAESLARSERLRAELAEATEQCQVLSSSTSALVQERLQLTQQLAAAEAAMEVSNGWLA